MTQYERARGGTLSPEAAEVARTERVDGKALRASIAAGAAVIPRNLHRKARPTGIGAGLSVKTNANIGTSPMQDDVKLELAKLDAAIEAGADTVMDLSVGEDPRGVLRAILERCPLPVGTVPLYEIARSAGRAGRSFVETEFGAMLDVIRGQAEEGVDFMTIHAGATRRVVETTELDGRVGGIVSRGGSMICEWMRANDAENPLYERFEELLAVLREHDVTISIGDALRPGSVVDATDRGQIAELSVIGELVETCRRAGVQAIVEGPGHVPLSQIETNVRLEKRLCDGAPFYVLGPIVTDVAPGYDHITAAIGGALAAWHGADFLCYVTPSEHLALPDVDDVRSGVVAARIAAHAGDVARGVPRALEWDRRMSRARTALDWDAMLRLSVDRSRAEAYRRRSGAVGSDVCTMCGEFCAVKKGRGKKPGGRKE